MAFKLLLLGATAILLAPSDWLRAFPALGAHGARAERSSCTPTASRVSDIVAADIRRLHADLLCDYDRLIVPPGTEVEINLYIYRLHLDVHRGFLQTLVDLAWRWHDPRLSWDPTQYSDVEETVFTEKDIWIPDLEALNSLQRDFETLRCLVTSAGNVTCNPVYNMQTTCGSNVRRWPMDEHECVFEMASRNHDNREYTIILPINTTEVMVHPDASHEWVVVNASQTRREAVINSNFHFSRLEVRLSLRRHGAVHILTVGVPTLVLPSLVLAQLWVDPRWPGRLLLGCTTTAALCMYLQYLGDTVPDDTQGQAPLIVLFYRNSLVIATLVVLLTVALRGLADRPGAPPSWLTAGSSWLLRAVPRPVTGMLLEDEDDEEEDGDGDGCAREAAAAVEHSEQMDKAADTAGAGPRAGASSVSWKKMARIVDRLAFLALAVTFIVLLFAESA